MEAGFTFEQLEIETNGQTGPPHVFGLEFLHIAFPVNLVQRYLGAPPCMHLWTSDSWNTSRCCDSVIQCNFLLSVSLGVYLEEEVIILIP